MNELQIFHYNDNEVRTVQIDGEPWWVLKDVCEVFGETNYRRVSGRLDEDEKGVSQINTPGGIQNMTIINESGLYSVLFVMQPEKARGVSDEYIEQRKEQLRTFRRWVTSEVLPSIRKTGGYHVSERPEQIKLEAQKARAEAMLLNAKNRTFQTIMSAVQDKNLSPIAIQVFGLKGLESVFGVDVGNYLPQIEKTYTATEIGEMFGISANKVGSLANKNGMKTEEYGIVVMDKSKYSKKEVSSFRYNEKAVERFREILQV